MKLCRNKDNLSYLQGIVRDLEKEFVENIMKKNEIKDVI